MENNQDTPNGNVPEVSNTPEVSTTPAPKQMGIGEATPEQIAAWKQEHGEVHEVEVEGHLCYLKNPSRKVLGYASTAGKQNPIKFNEIMLAGCWVGGDEKMKTDDSLFLAVGSVLQELVQVKEATIKKL